MKKIYAILILIFSLAVQQNIYALTTKVNTLTALKTAFTAAMPGDSIIILNGTYNWGGIVLTNSNNTSTGAWIVLKAESLSGVMFIGNTYLQFSGTRILVDGFKFANGNSGTNAVMAFRSSSSVLASYSRITNITVDNYNSIDTLENEWVAFYGTNNRLDHCNFINKSNPRATVVVWYSTATFPAQSISTYHKIDSNYFSGRSYMGGNGGETIRVGVGNNSRTYGYNIVEYNLFENCIQTEPEIVSNKSAYNTYRYNTFKNCNGGLTLRMGKYCTVYGNFFINNDPTKTASYGIRIIDKGHKVFNNYCEGLLGSSGSTTSMRTPIVIYNGLFSSADSLNPLILNGAYLPADSAVVAFNTIVNCSGGHGIKLGFTDGGLNTYAPLGVTLANNVIKMSSGQAIYNDPINTSLTYFAEGNVYNAPSGLGITNTTGFKNTTLNFGATSNGILTAPSNVQDSAINTATYTQLIGNIDAQGQTRSTIFDVGCDELNGAGQIMNRPLDTSMVGVGKAAIIPLAQTITFPAIAAKTVSSADFSAGATASSGLAVTYTSSNTSVATIVNNLIHIVGYGTAIITASQAGNTYYYPATSVSQTLTVTGLSQTITFPAIAQKTVGVADFSGGATASSGLTITYTSSNTAVATIVNNLIHVVGVGTTVITASQSGNSSYYAATSVSQTLNVIKTVAYVPSTTTILFGSLNSGAFGNLSTNNSSYYVVNSTTTSTRKVDWYGSVKITQPGSSVSKLTINYDGKNSASKTQVLYLYNWSTSAWVQIDSRTVSTTDISVAYTNTSPANYISSLGEIRLRVYSSGGNSNYTCSGDWMQFTVESTSTLKSAGTSVETTNDLDHDFTLSPNPASNQFVYSFKSTRVSVASLQIYNASGKLVKSVFNNKQISVGNYIETVDTKEFAIGMYFIRLQLDGKVQTRKIMINKQ